MTTNKLSKSVYPLTGKSLLLARMIWGIIVGLTLIVVIAALPIRFEQYQSGIIGQGSLDIVVDYRALDLPQLPITIYFIILDMTFVVIFFCLGFIIFWQNSADAMTIFISISAITISVFFTAVNWSLSNTMPAWIIPAQIPSWIGSTCFLLFLLVFPDGQFIPKWSKWIVIPYALYELYRNLLTKLMAIYLMPPSLEYLLFLSFILVGIYAQIIRYQRHSDPVQQQQTKLVVLGITIQFLSLLLLLGILVAIETPYFSDVITPQVKVFFGLFVSPVLYNTFGFFTILSLAFAIFRHRLWDVDLVINRSLVYGTLVLFVLSLFFGIVLILQTTLGNTNPFVALIISGVFSAALFRPVRNRIQNFVDRHIYGLRFDLNELNKAQQTLTIANPGNLTGLQLGGYELRGVVGKGGMGEVYEAIGNGHSVAVKTILRDVALDQEARTRFIREGDAGKILQHPNIVPVLDSGDYNGIPYIIMEYVRGEDLGTLLTKRSKYDVATALQIVADVCSALELAHNNGYVHRDIKPSNIMIRENGEAVLMDFGITKLIEAQTITDSGLIGTIHYMAPEQIEASKDVDHRADIYALACVLYQMLTSHTPFTGSIVQIMFAHLHQPVPDPRNDQPDIVDYVAEGLLKALEKDPDSRFASIKDFADAINIWG